MSIRCEKLSCGYDQRTVLSDVTFAVQKGSVTALLGPNGSGKSTLLKTLCKTLQPMSGNAYLQDSDISRIGFEELSRLAAYVPQEETQPFPFKVREVVLMGRVSQAKGFFDNADDVAIAQNAMSLADCADLAERPVTELSGGERQRTLIARALAQQTPILLLDEPSSHLDVGHQVALANLLRGLSDKGHTILIAVHDLNYASVVSHHSVLLKDGKVGAVGETRDILQSSLLDEVYGVQFYRFEDEKGTFRVFPERALN